MFKVIPEPHLGLARLLLFALGEEGLHTPHLRVVALALPV